MILDIDECAAGTFTCGTNARCVNLPGTYRCQCSSGYQDFNSTLTPGLFCRGKYTIVLLFLMFLAVFGITKSFQYIIV